MTAEAVPTTGTTIPLDGPTRAFTQGVADGSDLADAIPGDRDAWLFFAGRAFALRHGEDQQSAEAQSYVQGISLRRPGLAPDDSRTGRARAALDAAHPGSALDEAIPDLLADLLHLIDAERADDPDAIDRYGVGWTAPDILRDLLRIAEGHYDDERDEDDDS